jgi:hypothetical protein
MIFKRGTGRANIDAIYTLKQAGETDAVLLFIRRPDRHVQIFFC